MKQLIVTVFFLTMISQTYPSAYPHVYKDPAANQSWLLITGFECKDSSRKRYKVIQRLDSTSYCVWQYNRNGKLHGESQCYYLDSAVTKIMLFRRGKFIKSHSLNRIEF